MASAVRTPFAWVGAAALLMGIAILAAGPERRSAACVAIGLCPAPADLTGMLAAVRQEQALLVMTARLVEPVTSARDTTLGPLTLATTRQTSILPATVTYRLDLSKLADGDVSWDADARRLTVRRPPVSIGEPTIHWDRAQTYGDEGWVALTTGVRDRLREDNQKKAPAEFRAMARQPELLAMADEAADRALNATFRVPLAAAGFADATIKIVRP